MTRTIFYTASSLDGYLADEQDSLDWLFTQDQDEHGPLSYAEFFADVGAILTGSTTYAWVLAHEHGAWPFSLPTWVMTRRERALPTETEAEVRFARADDEAALRAVHAELVTAAGDRDVWVVGGGELAAWLAELGLLDELIVYLAPVTLGAGRPLLPRPLDLRLLELERNRAFACARYEVVGPRRSAPGPASGVP